MDDYLNWNNNNNNNTNSTNKDSPIIPNIPTSTINDEDLIDFSSLDKFIPNIKNDNDATTFMNYVNPSINEKPGNNNNDDNNNELNMDIKPNNNEFQPQTYHLSVLLTSSSYNSKPISSSLTGVRRSLSKAMTNSRKNSIIKDELSNSPYIKSPRSRKSSIVGTPNSVSQLGGQTTSVERKRRDNINDKIQELLTIIPDTFFYENEKSTGTKDGKPNKGQILTKSVEYIQYLQNEIDFKNRKEVESIYRLKKLNFDTSNFTNTSAEIGLGKIGVGPLSHLQHEQIKDKWLQQGQTEIPNSNDNNNNKNHNDNDNPDFLNF